MQNYMKRINTVLKYIDEHIDEPLSAETLCGIAHFSKYHFHRIFSAMVGMPLYKYIQYLKLKRAAHQLLMQKQKKIITIAFDAGFDSHEAFSRAFKKACGVSPSTFRKQSNWQIWNLQPYKKLGETMMNIKIKTIETINTACVKHRGSIAFIQKTAAKLIDWAKENNVTIKAGKAFGIAYNDPETTPDEEFRFNFCIQLPKNIKVNDNEIVEERIQGGRYAVARHLGSHDDLKLTVYALYRDWLPESGEELRDQPCMFQYHNFAHEVQESALITDVCLPLK